MLCQCRLLDLYLYRLWPGDCLRLSTDVMSASTRRQIGCAGATSLGIDVILGPNSSTQVTPVQHNSLNVSPGNRYGGGSSTRCQDIFKPIMAQVRKDLDDCAVLLYLRLDCVLERTKFLHWR
jgi:hypothetical protein